MFDCVYPYWPDDQIVDLSCLRTIFESAYRMLSWNIFNEETSTWTDAEKEDYLCGSGNSLVKHAYFRDACSKYCINLLPGPVTGGSVRLDVFQNSCTSEFCCQVERSYCYTKYWDFNSQTWVYVPQVTETKASDMGEVTCDDIVPLPELDCPVGWLQTNCVPTCDINE